MLLSNGDYPILINGLFITTLTRLLVFLSPHRACAARTHFWFDGDKNPALFVPAPIWRDVRSIPGQNSDWFFKLFFVIYQSAWKREKAFCKETGKRYFTNNLTFYFWIQMSVSMRLLSFFLSWVWNYAFINRHQSYNMQQVERFLSCFPAS